MQTHVVLAVVEVIAHSGACLYAIFGCHRDVSGVEEAMNIGAEKQSVSYVMRLNFREGTYVCGFERRQRSFSCNRALSPIRVGDDHSECALTKTMRNEHWIAVSTRYANPELRADRLIEVLAIEPVGYLCPQAFTNRCGEIVSFPANDFLLPVLGR